MKLCSPDKCTGCMACLNTCPSHAIQSATDEEGFYIPQVDTDLCTQCGLCESRCPEIISVNRNRIEQYGYACWSKDKDTRRYSSSGGVITELAKSIISQGGVVFGVAFDDCFLCEHIVVSDFDSIKKIRGSKYIQSRVNTAYINVKNHLEKNQPVMFTGTPCQVAGLYSFLENNYYDNLFTCDLVCHGVPSPNVFIKYKQWLEDQHRSKMISYQFRDKRKSWMWYNTKARFASDKEYIGTWAGDPFMRLFLRDCILRKSCYTCKYTNMNRMGDITVADFWGYKANNKKEKNTDEGISLALINTGNGEILFDTCKKDLVYFFRHRDIISKSQKSFGAPWPEPKNRAEFWRDYSSLTFDKIIEKYGHPEKMNFSQWCISKFGLNIWTKITSFCYYRSKGMINKVISIFNKVLPS